MDEPIAPWGFLAGGAVFGVLAAVMLMHASDGGESFLGYVCVWIAFVLTVAGSAALGVAAGQRR